MVKSIEIFAEKHRDKRGWLAEIFRNDLVGEFKQVYVSTLKQGMVRGNHYHKEKTEWFCVIMGKGKLTLWRDDDVEVIVMSDKDKSLKLIEVLPFVKHKIENVGKKKMILLSCSSTLYDRDEPDTYEV